MPAKRFYFFLVSLLRQSRRGFTLIELLVVVALIGILSTVILANYNSFGSRQQVRNAAEEFKSELRKYQTYAISGQKDPIQNGDCISPPLNPPTTLRSYDINITSGTPGSYTVTVVCSLGNVSIPQVDFPNNITVTTSCNDIKFFPLDEGAELCSGAATSVDIEFEGEDGTIYTVRVNKSGEIQVWQ